MQWSEKEVEIKVAMARIRTDSNLIIERLSALYESTMQVFVNLRSQLNSHLAEIFQRSFTSDIGEYSSNR